MIGIQQIQIKRLIKASRFAFKLKTQILRLKQTKIQLKDILATPLLDEQIILLEIQYGLLYQYVNIRLKSLAQWHIHRSLDSYELINEIEISNGYKFIDKDKEYALLLSEGIVVHKDKLKSYDMEQ